MGISCRGSKDIDQNKFGNKVEASACDIDVSHISCLQLVSFVSGSESIFYTILTMDIMDIHIILVKYYMSTESSKQVHCAIKIVLLRARMAERYGYLRTLTKGNLIFTLSEAVQTS